MDRKKVFLRFGFGLVLVLAIVHTAIHISAYGSGMSFIDNSKISGMAISENIRSSFPSASTFSFSVLGIEWLVLITMVVFSLVRQKIDIATEEVHYDITEKFKQSNTGSKTDLDILYELVKNYGSVRISSAAKLFKVDNDKIIEWANILENANLAQLNYPQVGEPEITLKE